MTGDDRILVASDRVLDREGPGAALAHRKDGSGRVGADRIAAETATVATLAGGMVLGAFYPAEAKAAQQGGTAAPPGSVSTDGTDRLSVSHGDTNDVPANVPDPVPVSHDAAALIQAEGDAMLARLEAAFEATTAAIGVPTAVAEYGAAVTSVASDAGAPALAPLSDNTPFHPGSVGGTSEGQNAIPRDLSDAVLGDHGGVAGVLGSAAMLAPSVADVTDTVAQSLDTASAALPSGLDTLLGSIDGPVATRAEGLTAPLQTVTDATGDILAPVASLPQAAGDIAAPVLGQVSDLVSGPVTAAASLVSELPTAGTSLVEDTAGTLADHAVTSVEGAVVHAAAPLDLPSLNLGFLGQSYSDLGHGEVGPHHDQGLLHGLV